MTEREQIDELRMLRADRDEWREKAEQYYEQIIRGRTEGGDRAFEDNLWEWVESVHAVDKLTEQINAAVSERAER